MALEVTHHRGSLCRTRQKIQEGALTVGFLGGSITDGRAGHNWPEPVINWLVDTYPGLRIQVENAAIGATGSDLAVFRAKRDIIDRDCDLVFVEYAVNDGGVPTEIRNRTREGLLRKLLADDDRDVVIVYTYSQDMYAFMSQGKMPPSIDEFEVMAEHYSIGSVWMGLHAMEEVKRGTMKWEEWLPDGLHPQYRGSLSYGASVIRFLREELREGTTGVKIPAGDRMSAPLNQMNWQNAYCLPFTHVTLEGPWKIMRWPHLVWMDQVLATAAVGAKMSFDFEGRGLSLGFDFGNTSAEFKYRIDGGEWKTSQRDRPDWCGASGWFRPENIADDLAWRTHHFELEVIHGDRGECRGTNFHLAFIGVIR